MGEYVLLTYVGGIADAMLCEIECSYCDPIALRRTRRFLGYGPEQNIAPHTIMF